MTFSLKWVLVFPAIAGVGCLALYNANELWAQLLMALTIFVFLVSVLGALLSSSRAFYTGVAIFGWSYLTLCYMAPFSYHGNVVRPLAITEELLVELHEYVERDVPVPPSEVARYLKGTPPTTWRRPPQRQFLYVGHALFALLFSAVGGAIGQWFGRSSDEVG